MSAKAADECMGAVPSQADLRGVDTARAFAAYPNGAFADNARERITDPIEALRHQ